MLAPYRLLFQHRVLAYELVRRELFDRYGNAVLGGAWVIIQPLALMLVFAFVFTFIFDLRFDDTDLGLQVNFGTFLIMGYQSWMCIMVGLSSAAMSLTGNVGLLKQIDFPTPVLVFKSIFTAMLAQVIGIIVGVLIGVIAFDFISPLLPLVLVLLVFQAMFVIGVGWLVAAITVFFRDMTEVMNTFFLINLYFMPVIWPPNQIHPIFAAVIDFNPYSYIVFTYQDALAYGRFEHPLAWIIFPAMAIFFFHFGYWVFRKMEPAYGDML